MNLLEKRAFTKGLMESGHPDEGLLLRFEKLIFGLTAKSPTDMPCSLEDLDS